MENIPDCNPIKELGIKYSDKVILLHTAIAEKAGLSGTDHKYLKLIIEKGQMTAGELAERSGLSTGAVTGVIDRLQKKQLIARQFDKSDRRKIIVVPNQKNIKNLLRPLFANLDNKTDKLIDAFTETEISTIKKYFLLTMVMMDEVISDLRKDEGNK